MTKVLVTVASRHGATAEIGEAIAATLRSLADVTVDVVPPGQVGGVGGYDAVVAGSAVYMGRWMPDARKFVRRFGPELATRPTWLFSSGPVGDPLVPADAPNDVVSVAGASRALDHHVFPGKLDRDGLHFRERAVVAALQVPDGDFRDFAEVAAWAKDIAGALQATADPPILPRSGRACTTRRDTPA
jgi:menaquinone-dependent protoporphyrinogen oxidase